MPLEKLPPKEPCNGWKYEQEAPCFSPEHNPPMMMRLEPGEYIWTCPACGKQQFFTAPGIGFVD